MIELFKLAGLRTGGFQLLKLKRQQLDLGGAGFVGLLQLGERLVQFAHGLGLLAHRRAGVTMAAIGIQQDALLGAVQQALAVVLAVDVHQPRAKLAQAADIGG